MGRIGQPCTVSIKAKNPKRKILFDYGRCTGEEAIKAVIKGALHTPNVKIIELTNERMTNDIHPSRKES